jgi:aminomethyltransferase
MDKSTKELKTTPLLNEHKRLGARIEPFGGWLMPIQYEGIIAEHNWTRDSASVFDICHMGEFLIYGSPEKSGLDRIVTFNLKDMPANSCHYGFMLNEKGNIVDDLVIYRLAQEEWMAVVNATTTDKDESHFKRHLSRDYKFKNISNMTAKLDLQGPLSAGVLKDIIGNSINDLKYYTFAEFKLLGQDVIISRTGYTGELGYEIYISSKNATDLWNLLLKDKRVKPAGLGARDTLRLEMGYSLYGQDIDETTTPVEAGLERFVDFNKDFIGKPALLKDKGAKPAKRLVYFISESRRSPRHNDSIYADGKEAGVVTSGSFSPSLSSGIGIGYIKPDYAKIGTRIIIKGERSDIEAAITQRPFYKNSTARSK